MFIAMNNFRVDPKRADDFERAWRERESYLASVPGFLEFHLLKGPVDGEGGQLYASHTTWTDEASFQAWTESEAFHKAHAQGTTKGMLLGPPRFIGWTAIL
jgi:heme-degrading monooxygenase HmoA